MRFKRSDLPGFAIAVLAPPLLTMLFLATYDVLGCVATILWMRYSGTDGSVLATGLKLLSVLLFFVVNAAIAWQVLANGLLPMLDRRAERRRDGAA